MMLAQQVGVVVRLDLLHHRGDALQPHAGIDGRFWQRHQLAVSLTVELHEDVVPDLHVAVAVAADSTVRRAAADLGTVVEEDLRTGTAGSGVTHRPEVVLLKAENPLARDAFLLMPDVGGFIIVGVDRDIEARLVDVQVDGEEFPGIGDRLFFEIVAEREVAEHLEEGVMTGCAADVLQVVVLAAGPDALLRSGGAHVSPFFLAEEAVLELVHAGIGKEQGRIVVRYQGRGRDHRMAAVGKELEKKLTYFATGLHRALQSLSVSIDP